MANAHTGDTLERFIESLLHELFHNLNELDMYPDAKSVLSLEGFIKTEQVLYTVLDILLENIVKMDESHIASVFATYSKYNEAYDYDNTLLFETYARDVMGLDEGQIADDIHLGLVIKQVVEAQYDPTHEVWRTEAGRILQPQLAPLIVKFLDHILLTPLLRPVSYDPADFRSLLDYSRLLMTMARLEMLSEGAVTDTTTLSEIRSSLGLDDTMQKHWEKILMNQAENGQLSDQLESFGMTVDAHRLISIDSEHTLQVTAFPSCVNKDVQPFLCQIHHEPTDKSTEVLLQLPAEYGQLLIQELETLIIVSDSNSETILQEPRSGMQILINWMTDTQYGVAKRFPWMMKLKVAGNEYAQINAFDKPALYTQQRLTTVPVRGAVFNFSNGLNRIEKITNCMLLPDESMAMCVPAGVSISEMLSWKYQASILRTDRGVMTASQFANTNASMPIVDFKQLILSKATLHGASQELQAILDNPQGQTVRLVLQKTATSQPVYVYQLQIISPTDTEQNFMMPETVWFE